MRIPPPYSQRPEMRLTDPEKIMEFEFAQRVRSKLRWRALRRGVSWGLVILVIDARWGLPAWAFGVLAMAGVLWYFDEARAAEL